MTVYDYKAQETQEQPGYEWTDRKGNILNVPDDSWDPAIDNDKGRELVSFLKQEQYDGPGDWNPL